MNKKLTLIAIIAVAVLILSACSPVGIRYANSNRYTSGDASISDRVRELNINWADGSVSVQYHRGSRLEVSETAGRSLNKDQQLHWYLDGSTLTIQYAASGSHVLTNLNKQLTVLLPDGLRLDDLRINVASAQVEADGVDAENIHICSASGRIALRQQGRCDELKVDSASGGVAVELDKVDTLNINTVSGVVYVNAAKLGKADVDSVSGKVTMQFAAAPDRVEVETVSGDATLLLSRNTGFTAELDSASGKLGGELLKGFHGDEVTVGNGKCIIDMDSVSGDLTIDENTAR